MDNLILSFTVVFPLFAQLVLGYGLKRIKLLDDHTLSVCNKLVFRVFLPCLLFLNVYRACPGIQRPAACLGGGCHSGVLLHADGPGPPV